SYHIAADKLQENAMKLSQDTVNKSGQIFDEKLQKIAVSTMSLMMSNSFENVTKASIDRDNKQYYSYLTEMQRVFSQLLFNEKIIQSILLATPIGDFYPTSSTRLRDYSFFDTSIYQEMKKDRRAIWLEGHADPYFSGQNRVLTLVMEAVTNPPTSDMYLLLNIKEKEMMSLLKQNLSASSGQILVLNSSGRSVMASSLSGDLVEELDFGDLQAAKQRSDPAGEMNDGQFEYVGGNTRYLVNYYQSQVVEDWVVYRLQSKEKILGQVDAIKWTAISIMSICILVALILSNIMARLLSKPLTKLSRLMSRVETTDDLGVRYRSRYNDEVSQAGFTFNRMLDRIERQIGDVQRSEQSKRKAEMKALTAQIDPHFFYNALHTVYCKSVLGENERVNEMIIALSEMFRLGLNNGEDVTTLGAELEHAAKYLVIQQNCYETLFDSIVYKDPEIPDDVPVLKLILQPLVENSILHGFKNRTEGGFIRIDINADGDFLYLEVADNGDGFDADELAEADQPPDTKSSSGYALRNIRDRLTLYYNQLAELTIRSDPGKGTSVRIRIPLERGTGTYGIDESKTDRN
ncbi:MAG: histidine kinase, partial [Paenibacillus sp.]|nr:histidine kinase [Paenibacillus sp.]